MHGVDQVESDGLPPSQVIKGVELHEVGVVLANQRRPATKLGGLRLRLLDEEAIGVGGSPGWTLFANRNDGAPRLLVGPIEPIDALEHECSPFVCDS